MVEISFDYNLNPDIFAPCKWGNTLYLYMLVSSAMDQNTNFTFFSHMQLIAHPEDLRYVWIRDRAFN